MVRALWTACFLSLLAGSAAADRVTLVDGRTLNGNVTIDGDTVQIEMEYGVVRIPRAEVQSIESRDTPEVELAKKVAQAPPENAPALAEIARWAGQSGLLRQAEELYGKAIKIDPNNAAARAALDFVRMDGEWRPFPQALELARSKVEANESGPLLREALPGLEELATSRDRQLAVRELAGLAYLRAGEFGAAAKTFEDLSAKATGPDAVRFAALAEILKESPDGMYVLPEPYPPGTELLEKEGPSLKAGPVSLRDGLALQAALHDRAKKEIEAARKLIQEAPKAPDPDAARAKNAQAARFLDRAEALAPGIARSYRVEMARARIAALRKDSDKDAQEFDKEMATLGRDDMAAAAYRAKVQRLIYLLDNVRDDLKEILDACKPYPRDLILEVTWAELDLKKIKEMREVLAGELDAKK